MNTPQENPQNEKRQQGCGTDHCLTNHQVYYSLQDNEQENECVGLLHGTTNTTGTFTSNVMDKYINDDKDTLDTGVSSCVSSSDGSTTLSTETSPNNNITTTNNINMDGSTTITKTTNPEYIWLLPYF